MRDGFFGFAQNDGGILLSAPAARAMGRDPAAGTFGGVAPDHSPEFRAASGNNGKPSFLASRFLGYDPFDELRIVEFVQRLLGIRPRRELVFGLEDRDDRFQHLG